MGTYTNLITNDSQAPVDQPSAEVAVSSAPAPKKKMTRRKQAHNKASMRASTYTRKQASNDANVNANMHAYVQQYLDEKATHGFTFRYPPQLLEDLEDVIYKIRKTHREKLPKNAIEVMALSYIIKDYLDSGEDSVLHQMLLSR